MKNKEIKKIYEKIIKPYWEKYLKEKGVKLPKLKNKKGKYTKEALVLVYLAQNYPNNKPVSKEELTDFVRKFYPNITDVQQARHLGRQKGFYIVSGQRKNYEEIKREKGIELKSGEYYLVSLKKCYPHWSPHRRRGIKEEEFEKIKEKFQNRCAICGSKERKPNFKNPNRITTLHIAHIDPDDPQKGFIPQCDECNRAYRNWFVFDGQGRVRTIASWEIVLRANEKVQWEIYKKLYEKYKGENPL
ncbi:MAG: hypothetical protein NC926_08825 [Candidatus Omnitrophica bacterium]|nr:hypothetical protein [Candidatus Omnitrophota bacterium]